MNQSNLDFVEESKMPHKTPAVISATLTVMILGLLAILFVLLQMVALNGASETQGRNAMGISLACQSLIILLLGLFAARSTQFLITKIRWNSLLAIAITVAVATMIGGTISFLSSVIAIPLAGIR